MQLTNHASSIKAKLKNRDSYFRCPSHQCHTFRSSVQTFIRQSVRVNIRPRLLARCSKFLYAGPRPRYHDSHVPSDKKPKAETFRMENHINLDDSSYRTRICVGCSLGLYPGTADIWLHDFVLCQRDAGLDGVTIGPVSGLGYDRHEDGLAGQVKEESRLCFGMCLA